MKLLLALTLMTLPSSGSGQDYADPTFDNRFNLLHCSATMREFCSQDFCSNYPEHTEHDYFISLKDRSLSDKPTDDPISRQKLNFTEISSSGSSKILFEKFEFDYRGANKKAMLVYLPARSDYTVGIAIDTIVPVTTTNVLKETWNGLAIDRWIESGECERK